MDYLNDVYLHCPVEIVQEIRLINFANGSDSFEGIGNITYKLETDKNLRCLNDFLLLLISNVNVNSDEFFIRAVLSSARVNAYLNDKASLKPVLEELFKTLPYYDSNRWYYFMVLRDYMIDIRTEKDDIFIKYPIVNDDSTGFYYALYITKLGDQRGVEILRRALEESEHNMATFQKMLEKTSQLAMLDVRPIIAAYANDQRRLDSYDGPGTGIKVSELVRALLETIDWK